MSSRLSLRTARDLDLQTWRFDSAEPDESAQGIKLFVSDYQSEASPESSVAVVGLPPQEWSGITILQANAYFGLKTYSNNGSLINLNFSSRRLNWWGGVFMTALEKLRFKRFGSFY